MILVNDPLFFREAVRQYKNKPLKPHKPRKMLIYGIKETGSKKEETSRSQICEGQHDVED